MEARLRAQGEREGGGGALRLLSRGIEEGQMKSGSAHMGKRDESSARSAIFQEKRKKTKSPTSSGRQKVLKRKRGRPQEKAQQRKNSWIWNLWLKVGLQCCTKRDGWKKLISRSIPCYGKRN